MRWKDINGEWWTIPSEFSINKLSHRVPLSPHSLKIIEEVQSITEAQDEKPERDRSECVSPNPRNRSEHIREVQKLAQRVRGDAGVSYRAHDFRRTAASMMAG